MLQQMLIRSKKSTSLLGRVPAISIIIERRDSTANTGYPLTRNCFSTFSKEKIANYDLSR